MCVFSCERGELPSVQSCLTLSKPVTWNQRASERREQEGGSGDETGTARKSFFIYFFKRRRLSLNQITGADFQHAANKLSVSLTLSFSLSFCFLSFVSPSLPLHLLALSRVAL